MARQGAKVCVAARSADKLADVVGQIVSAGGTAHAVALDVLSRDSIEAAVQQAEDHLGPIAILVNNAGIGISKPFLKQTEADWDAVVDTNLKGAFLVAQAVARRMVARTEGTIVNVASMMAHATITQLTPYAVSKGGLMQMTRNMASNWHASASGLTLLHRATSGRKWLRNSSKRLRAKRSSPESRCGGSVRLKARRAFAAAVFGCVALHDGLRHSG